MVLLSLPFTAARTIRDRRDGAEFFCARLCLARCNRCGILSATLSREPREDAPESGAWTTSASACALRSCACTPGVQLPRIFSLTGMPLPFADTYCKK